MSKLARALTLVVTLAAICLAGMTTGARAHTSNDPASTRHRALGQVGFLATEQPAGQADATVRRLLARERSAKPTRQAGWRIPALGVLAAVLALVAGVAVLATRRANRTQRASQTA